MHIAGRFVVLGINTDITDFHFTGNTRVDDFVLVAKKTLSIILCQREFIYTVSYKPRMMVIQYDPS